MQILVSRNGKNTVREIVEGVDVDVYALYHLRRGKQWKSGFVENVSSVPIADIRINWAYSGVSSPSAITYNKPSAIALSSDKPACRVALREAGVPIPRTMVKEEVLEDIQLPYVCRTAKHQAGSGFKMAYTTKDLFDAISEGYYYFSDEYRKKKEYRVHVAHGKVLIMQEKVPIHDDSRANIIWNHASGEFVFGIVGWNDMPVEVCKVALDGVKAVGLDFGAVDVLWSDEEDDRAVVCEINTSPALADYATYRYRRYFKWLLRSQEARPHYDYSEYTRPKSFAFKNFQLEE